MSRTVPFYDFHKLHSPGFQEKINARFAEIVSKNGFVEGEYNFSFEEKFAEKQGAKHCLLVANGTDALEISLLAYGLKPGDKVAVAGITFYASGEAVLNMGMIPVYVDVVPNSGLMCPKSLERVLENHDIKAVMPVHIYGLPADMKAINELCAPKKIPVIEDAAQGQGGYIHSGPIGSGGNLVTFSFYPTKNLGAFGDAGAILTDDDDLALIIKTIRNHGRSDLELMGRNSRCDHLQAAVLDLKLETIDEENKQRKQIATWYHEALKDLPINLVDSKYLETSSWHLYPVFLSDSGIREKAQAAFKEAGIGCTPFYERSLNQEKVFNKFTDGEWAEAEKMAGTVLCLPMNPFITQEDVSYVAENLKKVL